MQNKFCKALSNAVSFRIHGESNPLTFNPCCIYDEYIPFHPVSFKKQRAEFAKADTKFLPGCSKCKLKEITHNGSSARRAVNLNFPDDIGDDIYKLEIVLDTTCNAACIQCSSSQSSLWRNEVAARDSKYIHIQPTSQIDLRIEQIKRSVDIQKVKIWHFWGGEPLLTDTHTKFLNQIEDLSTVSLKYTTNGSIFPNDDVLELWNKCKQVMIGVSTDGIDDRFHYIRWPITFNKWSRVVERFKNETSSNVKFHINYCVLPLNALYTDELDEWAYKNFSKRQHGETIEVRHSGGEGPLDIACTPMTLREEIWKRLGERHPVSRILEEVPLIDPGNMLMHLDKWDPIRKLDWRKTFPDIVRHFK